MALVRSFAAKPKMQKKDLEDFDLLMNNLNQKLKTVELRVNTDLDRSRPYVHQIKENVAYIRSPDSAWKNHSIVQINSKQRGLILAL